MNAKLQSGQFTAWELEKMIETALRVFANDPENRAQLSGEYGQAMLTRLQRLVTDGVPENEPERIHLTKLLDAWTKAWANASTAAEVARMNRPQIFGRFGR